MSKKKLSEAARQTLIEAGYDLLARQRAEWWGYEDQGPRLEPLEAAIRELEAMGKAE